MAFSPHGLSAVDWDALARQFGGRLRWVEGGATDIAALREAGADAADRILLMPYATWQDYRVGQSGESEA